VGERGGEGRGLEGKKKNRTGAKRACPPIGSLKTSLIGENLKRGGGRGGRGFTSPFKRIVSGEGKEKPELFGEGEPSAIWLWKRALKGTLKGNSKEY